MRWGIRRPHRLGIALSGGGARGFAHIRVLRVLVEAGWRPEIVTGTSAGGIVGGLFAAGLSPEAIEALARRISWRMFMRLDPNGNALVGTERWARFLREAIGDVRIEDLPIRFAAVAVDLDTGEEIWIDRGPLIAAMLATSAFPGIFPPVEWEGRRLVDGGVLNPLPADAARALGATFVIGVDLSWVEPGRTDRRFPEELPGPLLVRWLTRRARWNRTLEVIFGSAGIMARWIMKVRLVQTPPDWLIRVPTGDIPVFALDLAPEILERGEQAARAALAGLEQAMARPRWLRRLIPQAA
ncbi:MAG: patatin-like phospholipase family protein [Thermoflexus sp.]|uniref:patatin-like phospholipase family protein n=1 Tax=Thermoflexus sp. TaxID=1969742 RepID=UPI0025F71A7C|nr:patatin-like phospholipase family protein [Thermoflexus sp.]MCS6962564.1 patatin-like phospholipase family protein [Thermoflexus sp.]